MLCDQCKDKTATVFLTQIVHGMSTQRNLCESCAAPIVSQITPTQWNSGTPTDAFFQEVLERPADCPSEVSITDPITVRDLAAALRGEFYQIVAVLMQHDIFKSANDVLDFSTASLVCQHYDVTPHKIA